MAVILNLVSIYTNEHSYAKQNVNFGVFLRLGIVFYFESMDYSTLTSTNSYQSSSDRSEIGTQGGVDLITKASR